MRAITLAPTEQMSEHPQPQEASKDFVPTEAWSPLFRKQNSFLNDLECIAEMFSVVLPVLTTKDKERVQRIKQIKGELEKLRSESETKGWDRISASKLRDILSEAVEHTSKRLRSDRMFRRSIVTTIVSQFDEFLTEVLKVCYRQNPAWLKNSEKKISYKEILEIESLDSLKVEIIQSEIDGLMRDSHHSQLKFLDSRLKLGIEAQFSRWHNFLEITERRNLFVHTGGIVSPTYIQNCRSLGISLDNEIAEGSLLGATDTYIQNTLDCFYELSVRVAQAVARRLFPACFDDVDKAINNQGVQLLTQERWELAERIFDFALNIPGDLTTKGEMKYYFLINRCIAMKFSGQPFKEYLHSVDWTPFHPKYHLAVAVLEDRFDEAISLMRSQAVQEQVTEEFFRNEWPLFREFRKTDAFLTAFREIYKKDLGQELLEDAEKEIKAQQEKSGNLALLSDTTST